MTDTNLLDDPIIVDSIHKASEELLRRSQNRENQSLEQRIESVERKVDFLLETVKNGNRLQMT